MDNDLKIIYGVWIFVVAVTILFLPFVLSEVIKYEWYNGLTQSSEICSPTSWRGQSFTVGNVGPDENFDITYVEVFGIRNEATGTVYAEIYAVDGSGYPTDDPLSSGSADFSSWDSYDYYSINMSSYELQASTQYALVLHATGEGVDWWYDATSPSYTGGKVVYSNNGGSSWGSISTWDFNFNVWGEAAAEDTCTCAGAGNDWEIDMSDYCNITEACDLTTGTLNFTGAGWCNCNASVNTTNLGDPGSDGILYIQDSCIITIN